MKIPIKAGSIRKTLEVFIPNAASALSAGLVGVAVGGGLTAWYHRQGATTATQITLVAATTVGVWVDSGWKEVDSTNMPGHYELHLPDAVVAKGADWVTLHLKGETNMVPIPIEIVLTDRLPWGDHEFQHSATEWWGLG